MTTMKQLFLPALAVAVLAVLGAGAGTLFATDQQPPFRVLAETAEEGDALPQAVLDSPGAADLGPAETARRVATYEDRTYYLMRGAEDRLCLVDYKAPDNVGAICVPWQGDSLKTLVSHSSFDADGNRFTAVLAPDGYDELWAGGKDGASSSKRVVDNLAIVPTDETTELALVGDGVEPLALQLMPRSAMLGPE
ncbi:MAG TPA: hypothetical protein VF529_12240 [Solirubrobacteraceae bacterium]|jgi:hypothetical protein